MSTVAAFIQANTNGRLHSAHEPALSPLSRGFLYGDGIYEVWRTYHGTVFAWHEHWDRLERSARALHLDLPWSRTEMFAEVVRTVAAFRAAVAFRDDVYVRLQVSRGEGPIGLDVALADRPEFVLLVQPCPASSTAVLQRGLRLSVATGLRRNPIESLNPAWKTGNYLNNILGLREARARGADDVVMLNLHGEVTEAATSNIALVRDGEVYTPGTGAGILEGITRGLLLGSVAPAAGVRVHEATLRPPELAGMSECFLLSTTKGLTPVGAIDGMRYAVGPDTVTARLQAALAHHVREYVAAHPELKA
ncbi:aminotransferase class IV [Horticoccus sp. 23ND18S-11]|uniref:aminotransferase class IV n=1 Tax=Horticoccus sp. 23ND18S-11 TaxID=3391832 RepID=UPI0039C9CBBD